VTREEPEHAIRAACDVGGDAELWVFGSQSILGQYPEAPEALRMSIRRSADWGLTHGRLARPLVAPRHRLRVLQVAQEAQVLEQDVLQLLREQGDRPTDSAQQRT